MTKSKNEHYKNYIESQLKQLTPFLQKYSMGDFSKQIPIPKEENELTELLVGLNLMVDDIKELIHEKEETINEINQIKDTLLIEKEFTETILNTQQDTFFLFEPTSGKAIRWNKAFRDISGYTDKEIAQLKAPSSYYSKEDLKRAFAFIQEVLKKGKGRIELELICKDGRKIPTEYVVSVIKDEKGEPRYFISIGRDITKQKRVLTDLNNSRQFLNNVFNGIQDGISVLDTEFTITQTNKWMEKMYSDKIPLIGKKCYQVYQEKKSLCPWCPSKHTLKDGKQHTEIVPYPSEENPKGWIELSSYPLTDRTGKITGVIEHVKDISDRMQAEEKVKNTMAELEKSNRELKEALAAVKTLSGLIPICSVCKKIRDDQGYWNLLELYLKEHTDAEFTHGICPECEENIYHRKK